MCCLPFAKRQPSQRAHRSAVGYGQSNLDTIGPGTSMSIPPSLSISYSNWLKSTTMTWLMGRPGEVADGSNGSAAPPTCIAALTFEVP